MSVRFWRSIILVSLAIVVGFAALAAAAQRATRQQRAGWDRIPHSLPNYRAAAPGVPITVPRDIWGRILIEDELPEPQNPVDEDGNDVIAPASARHGGGSIHTIGPNVLINNLAGDAANTCNSENSIVGLGPNLVAGWNDGLNFGVSPGNSGYGYSTDYGMTWTDGGVPPATAPGRYEGDPSLAVDNAGNYYYANLFTPDGFTSAISVNHGKFTGSSFAWDPPVLPASTTTDFLDKEWVAVDPVGGNVYLTYTRFLGTGGQQIEFSRSTDQGVTWSVPAPLTTAGTSATQGSRPIVGPAGEIYVIYYAFDYGLGNDYYRVRKSTDGGMSWDAESNAGGEPIYGNFGSGPPGYNRNYTIGSPSIAVDRSSGPYSGMVYALWAESVNYYYDFLGTTGPVAESEGNDTPGTADPITVGDAVTGNLSTNADQDWFSFSGTAGETVIFYLLPADPPATPADGFLRLFCGGGATANRISYSYFGGGVALCVYTLPSSGTYYARVLAAQASGGLGDYVLYTGAHGTPNPTDVARDARDVVITRSMDGVTWTPRAVINDDGPFFDNAFPEVAVDGFGGVHSIWYDHSADGNCGILTDVRYTQSVDAAGTWSPSARVNDGPTENWNLIATNLIPNMGDYISLYADGLNVYANFADGRLGSPDSWVATIVVDQPTPVEVSIVRADAEPGHVSLRWQLAYGAGLDVTIERSLGGGAWTTLATTRPDASGFVSYEDRAVSQGMVRYRLGVPEGAGIRYLGDVDVAVPGDYAFALHARNPSSNDLQVGFSLANAAPAKLELIDIAGRTLESRSVGGRAGTFVERLGAGTELASGVYVVRLTQGNRVLQSKVSVIR